MTIKEILIIAVLTIVALALTYKLATTVNNCRGPNCEPRISEEP